MDRGGKYDQVFEKEEEETEKGEEKTWLDHMTGYLTWKVTGLDLNNPYTQVPTIPYLRRMISDETFFMTHISVRCTCDGHEVFVLQNPQVPRIQSDHPCVSALSPNVIMDHLSKNKIDDMIFQEVDKMRTDIEKLINDLEEKKVASETKAQKSKPAKPAQKKPKAQETQLRIIRR